MRDPPDGTWFRSQSNPNRVRPRCVGKENWRMMAVQERTVDSDQKRKGEKAPVAAMGRQCPEPNGRAHGSFARSDRYWRNQTRSQRRRGQRSPDLEKRAKKAGKEYHDAIRRQRKAQWDDFLADGANIWQSARYLKPAGDTTSDKIPPLKRTDGTKARDKAEQAKELLSAFFPPLLAVIEDEDTHSRRTEVEMPNITLDEVEQKVKAAKAWKAPGEDGVPAMGWK
ncbi:hypothetical protein MRS44_013176 [Fusarium solani]|uniref:uncharacterized protein n=1 Tax=Fusarium solani TaxID=169388 RepID=UPI0032C4692E|nr:hypothetical protein MRS44_013176 [Fusarium solani]